MGRDHVFVERQPQAGLVGQGEVAVQPSRLYHQSGDPDGPPDRGPDRRDLLLPAEGGGFRRRDRDAGEREPDLRPDRGRVLTNFVGAQ